MLTALSDLLTDAGVPHAAVEVEELARAFPAVSAEERLRRVAAVVASPPPPPLLLVADTLTSAAEIDALAAAVGASERFVARLEAPVATLRARIEAREPASWSGLPALLLAAESLAPRVASLPADLVIATEGRDALDVARDVAQRIVRS